MKLIFLSSIMLAAQLALAGLETIKLYDEPRIQLDSFCQPYTEIVLTTVANKAEATLTNKIDGDCELYAEPNQRSFKLTKETDAFLGTVVYQGEGPTGKIEIKDYRNSMAEIALPALFMVQEYDVENDSVYVLYSKDN